MHEVMVHGANCPRLLLRDNDDSMHDLDNVALMLWCNVPFISWVENGVNTKEYLTYHKMYENI